jgi:hypothetical protein
MASDAVTLESLDPSLGGESSGAGGWKSQTLPLEETSARGSPLTRHRGQGRKCLIGAYGHYSEENAEQ